MFDWLFDGLAGLLSFFFDVTGSIGASIILLTLAVMLITSPLTMKGTRSMMKMQRLAPEVKKIQQRHKDDREKMTQELQAFYAEHDISPLGGCLPLIVQMPVFFVLFQLLRGLGNVDTLAGGALEPDPKYIDPASALYDKIVDAGGELISWGFDLADSATSAHSSFVGALPYYALIAMVGATSYLQQRQAMGRRDPNTPITPQQQMMQRIMVFFLPLISLSIPAGVVVYFVFSNVFRMGQQWLIHHLETRDKERLAAAPKQSARRDVTDAVSTEKRPDAAASAPRSKPHPRSKKKKRKKRR